MTTTLTIADERPSNGWAVYDAAGTTLARAPTRRHARAAVAAIRRAARLGGTESEILGRARAYLSARIDLGETPEDMLF
jgi:hypothetical protein